MCRRAKKKGGGDMTQKKPDCLFKTWKTGKIAHPPKIVSMPSGGEEGGGTPPPPDYPAEEADPDAQGGVEKSVPPRGADKAFLYQEPGGKIVYLEDITPQERREAKVASYKLDKHTRAILKEILAKDGVEFMPDTGRRGKHRYKMCKGVAELLKKAGGILKGERTRNNCGGGRRSADGKSAMGAPPPKPQRPKPQRPPLQRGDLTHHHFRVESGAKEAVINVQWSNNDSSSTLCNDADQAREVCLLTGEVVERVGKNWRGLDTPTVSHVGQAQVPGLQSRANSMAQVNGLQSRTNSMAGIWQDQLDFGNLPLLDPQ